MASSSVSQESLDTVDYEQSARKSKIRSMRAKGVLPRSSEREADPNDKDQNGDEGFSGEHESPSRGGVGRAKDKRTRPSHLKGKMGLKDKRKLREKRRSTGVVHLQSTESTGDSLDDEDIVEEGTELKTVSETKKNTSYNEAFSVEGRRHRTNDVARKAALYNERVDDNQPQSPSDRFGGRSAYNVVRNKSPSDLEADLEDNQDYDSTVSHSETNLSVIGKSESTDSNTYSPKTSRPPNSVYSRISPSDPTLSYKPSSPRNNLLWESPRTNKQSSPSSDHDTRTTHTVLNRFPFAANQNQNKDSEQSNKPKSFPSVLSRFPQSNHDQENKLQSNVEKDSQKQSYHDSSQFRSTYRDLDSKSRTHDVETKTKSPPSYRSNHGNTENQTGSHHREKFMENMNSSNQRRYPRHNFEDSSSKLDEERAKFKDEKTKLEKKLDDEREENRQLKSMLENRDQKIVELEREIYCLNKDLEDLDEDYQKLQVENHALIRTVSQLSTRV